MGVLPLLFASYSLEKRGCTDLYSCILGSWATKEGIRIGVEQTRIRKQAWIGLYEPLLLASESWSGQPILLQAARIRHLAAHHGTISPPV